ncbi:MAG: hypothetical protein ACYDHO_03800, partial [Gaiellaceae bacterium]
GPTNTPIPLYKGCTIKVTVIDQTTGLPYTAGPATVTIASSRGSEQFQTDPATGIVSTNEIAGEPIVPGSNYVIDVDTSDHRHGETPPLSVPSNYPSVLWSDFTVTLAPAPPLPVTITVVVRRNSCPGGTLDGGATASIVWPTSPSDPTHNFSKTTATSGANLGKAVFTGVLPDTYVIKASHRVGSSTLQGTYLPSPVTITGDSEYCVPIK